MNQTLCPAQQQAYEGVRGGIARGHIIVLRGDAGAGKTTILRRLHGEMGGMFLSLHPFLNALRERHPLAMEETYGHLLTDALVAHDIVIVDDLDRISSVIGSYCSHYPRAGFLDAPMAVAANYAAEAGKKLVFSTEGSVPTPVAERCFSWAILEFTPADYEWLCRSFLGEAPAGQLDFGRIHRFAPGLNAHQLKGACQWLKHEDRLDTERFIDYLRSQELTSNVDLSEVQPVDLSDLKGIDDVIRSLEANIILPLENDELATELQLTPKRGVLLVGPPGTGKTTVGRALAHRLKSKFFLIDGTFISGTGAFYGRVHHVFEAARQNAPSIIFIDDSDAIFESGEELGLYRYLLTMLDGLESESSGRVCVMMTAMDVAHLPPALLRSGRIELWLEVQLPDAAARADILEQRLVHLPSAFADVDISALAQATHGFTGADLKRLVEDGKNLLAFDKARCVPLRTPTEYFLAAVEGVLSNKQRYAQAEVRAHRQGTPHRIASVERDDLDGEDDLP